MYHVGILQLTQNLDDAVQGFKQGLNDQGIAAEFHYMNADGNLNELPKLAAKLKSLDVELIFACSTPAAQAAFDLPGDIPVVFTPVFDPVGVKLVESMDKPGSKATGVSGMVKAAEKTAFIKRILPNVKKLGVLYHTEDMNALLELANFRRAAQNIFTLVELPVKTAEDLSNIDRMLTPDMDALFIPIGRIIEENFATVVYYTDGANMPVIASHAPNVPGGALAALVSNHHKLGEACAAKAAQILNGTSPSVIPVGIVEQPEILLNAFVAENLGIEFSPELLAEAKEIYE
ncbi:MAG: ABC transporter substrate-binding protein [Veillonellaceae bacterium]|nr:ABC transporter substrate-binding protein [Veillonellaceae bacterium]